MRLVRIRWAVGVPTLDVRDDGGYGPVEDSLFDDFFEGGYVVDIVDAFLLFNLAGWRGFDI